MSKNPSDPEILVGWSDRITKFLKENDVSLQREPSYFRPENEEDDALMRLADVKPEAVNQIRASETECKKLHKKIVEIEMISYVGRGTKSVEIADITYLADLRNLMTVLARRVSVLAQLVMQPAQGATTNIPSLPTTTATDAAKILTKFMQSHLGQKFTREEMAAIVRRGGTIAGPDVRSCSTSTIHHVIHSDDPGSAWSQIRDAVKFKRRPSAPSPATVLVDKNLIEKMLHCPDLPSEERTILQSPQAAEWIQDNPRRAAALSRMPANELEEGNH